MTKGLRGNGYPGSHDDDLQWRIENMVPPIYGHCGNESQQWSSAAQPGPRCWSFYKPCSRSLPYGRSWEKGREKELSDVSVKFNTHPRWFVDFVALPTGFDLKVYFGLPWKLAMFVNQFFFVISYVSTFLLVQLYVNIVRAPCFG